MKNNSDKNKKADIMKYEKNKLHTKYIVALSILVSFGSIVLSTYNQEAFVSQFSFAGTITSIILSIIAIWMSISGERSTNEIRNKISDSTDSLLKTSKKIKRLNNNYEKTMSTQLEELKTVQEQLTKILSSVDSVSQEVSQMQKNTVDTPTSENNALNSEQKKAIFNIIYQWATYNNSFAEFIFCHMIYFVTYNLQNAKIIQLNETVNYLLKLNVNINIWINTINTNWGVINTLISASLFNDEIVMNSIHSTISKYVNLQVPPI